MKEENPENQITPSTSPYNTVDKDLDKPKLSSVYTALEQFSTCGSDKAEECDPLYHIQNMIC